MELLKFCAVCVILALPQFGSSQAKRIDLVAGDSYLLSCDPNVNVSQLLMGTAHLLMRQPENVTVFKNNNLELKDQYPSSSYSMKLSVEGRKTIFQFNFTNLITSDSGLWQCVRDHLGNRTIVKNTTLSVFPAEDVGEVELTLTKVGGGKEMKLVHEAGSSESTTSTARLLSGAYTITCNAAGGYPKPVYTLFRNGDRISNETSATLNLTTADTNIGCNVMVNRKEFKEHSVYFNLDVVDVVPEINCETTRARRNDGKAVMNCTVVAADVTCKKVMWKSGTTNREFEHGGNKVAGYELSCMSNGKNSVWSSLAVRKVEDRHFEDTFFIRVKDAKLGDIQKEQSVKIIRKPGALNGSVQMTPVGSLALVTVLTLLKMVL
ncbi:uncharacterized protein LOC132549211 [Ylistrum balloti]|uniref:uncharacterized protein LOC132549211 n=1 Tax=Ylistrum balloti TaxID=509963 RepID=UPI002905DE37|nr:uncharacterized protein LOC132549211 [Ylistrum balloti]